ncbi:MAG: FAD-dependent monooxygenase [bacterium]
METEVLVVGAGPTGMAAAAALNRWGVKTRVIDNAAAASNHSKALAVQAGTLECLEDLLGPQLPQAMVTRGLPVKVLHLNIEGQRPLRVETSTIPSSHPYILVLEQSWTERLLAEHLAEKSVLIERSTELLKTQDHGEWVSSLIRKADGSEETVRSLFVLGCDGAHSVVRRQAGIEFKGNPYEGDFILGDVRLDWPLPDGEVQIFIGRKGALAAFPIQGDRRFRLILVPKEKKSVESLDISPEEFVETARALCPEALTILESIWLTRFRVHHRRAETFQKGRLFLLGDAAHIHSPLGGQGMNTGIQDAVNLAFKVARVLRHDAPLDFLSRYQAERLPVAEALLRNTDAATRTLLLGGNPFLRALVFRLAPRLGRLGFLRAKIIRGVSQIDIARREIKERHQVEKR